MIRFKRPARSRPALVWTYGLALFGIAACASGTDSSRPANPGTVTRPAVATTVADPDEFLVVDCMLPAQVKR
ncbi:MAG: hypothetical protein R3349_06690, partial [Geminicoccaceae bacterium]|nr:hypothetical protein [Geminicoccaceae bacterium]